MRKAALLLIILLTLCPCVLAQESSRQTVAINFKDTTKKAVTGTLISLDMTQITVETDEVRRLGLKIDLQQVASIIFFDIPLTTSTVKPAPVGNSDTVTCGTVSIKQPELRGLRLGMSIDEVKTAKPTVHIFDAVDEAGEQTAFVSRPDEGVRALRLEFLDGRLKSIKATYDGSVAWNSEQQFLSRLAEAFGLPKSWNGFIQCQGLSLSADYNSGIIPEIRLYNPAASQIIRKRRSDIEEKKRRDFKP